MTSVERGRAAKERILLASIASLERWGIEGLTVRGIAKEARVNVAAVNYHFGSKAALLQIALHETREHGSIDPLAMLDAELDRLRAGKAKKILKSAARGRGVRSGDTALSDVELAR